MEKRDVIIGQKEFFKGIGPIHFEGPDSDNPFAFKYYEPGRIVAGKSMAEHFRFAVAYWHTFGNTGGDPFGLPSKEFPWLEASDPLGRARDKMDAAFEFMTKLGASFFCFHDVDLVDEGSSLENSRYRQLRSARYASFESGAGRDFSAGSLNLIQLAKIGRNNPEPEPRSGQQELFENIINQFV